MLRPVRSCSVAPGQYALCWHRLYAGITGTIQITEKFAGIGARYTSGAKKGQCNMSNSAQPLAFYGSITGTGKVSFT